MFRRIGSTVVAGCIAFAGLSACIGPRPALIQGMLGATAVDDLEFVPPAGGDTVTSDPDVIPTLGFSVQQSLTAPEAGWDAGIEGGVQMGWVVNSYAFLVGGGGGTIAVSADSPFLELFGGGWVGRYFQNGTRIFLGAGPLWLGAWVSSDDPLRSFSDSSSRFGTYVRGGIEFDIGPAGTLGLTVQRTDSELNFNTLGVADYTGYTFSVSLTRSL